MKQRCVDCGGSQVCKHNKRKDQCRECGGNGFCQHNKRKARCREFGGMDFANTTNAKQDVVNAVRPILCQRNYYMECQLVAVHTRAAF
jgi:hypothetical protein